MTSMDNFTTLIQLISAINCAFIVISFFDRVYSMFFNVDQMKSTYFSPLTQSIDLCQGSLENLNPPDTPDWKVFRRKKERLKQRLDIYKAQQAVVLTELEKEADNIRQVTGLKSFFLFISIYCFIDLFLIALMKTCPWSGLVYFQISFNFTYLFCCFFFMNVIDKKKWNGKHASHCYHRSIFYFSACFFISMLLCVLSNLLGLTKEMVPSVIQYLDNLLSVVLPFCPIVFAYYYFLDQKERIYAMAKNQTEPIKDSVVEVLNEKNSLEHTYYDMTHDEDIIWGGAA